MYSTQVEYAEFNGKTYVSSFGL